MRELNAVLIIACLIENLVVVNTIGIFFEEISWKLKYIFIGFLSFIAVVSDSVEIPFFIILPIVLLVLYSFLNFNENKGEVIVCSLFVFLLNIIITFLLILVFEILFGIQITDYYNTLFYLFIVILSKLLFTAICHLYRDVSIKKNVNLVGKELNKLLIVFLIFIFILFIFIVSFYSLNHFKSDYSFIVLIILITFIIMFIYLFNEISKLNFEKKSLIKENTILQSANSIFKDRNDICTLNEKNNHDYKNHLISIKYYVESEKYKEAIEYIDNILETKSKYIAFCTGNEFLDYILSIKYEKMHQENIQFHFSILNNLKFLDSYSLSVIIGNLLDNAIESQVNLCNKRIDLLCQTSKSGILLIISNRVRNEVKVVNNSIESTKRIDDGQKHGIGLNSVKEVLLKNNAIYKISCSNCTFEFKIKFLGKQ